MSVGDGTPAGHAVPTLDIPVPQLWGGLLAPVWAGTPIEAVCTDAAIIAAMLGAEAALARAQASVGLIPVAAAEAIGKVTASLHIDPADLARRSRAAANPVVALVDDLATAVRAADPSAADHVHAGSTSQDILDTALMTTAAAGLRVILTDLDRVQAAVAALAVRHRDTPMAGRTLTMHAVPVTFGLKAATWLAGTGDAARDLRRTLDELPVQLGGAAGTLAGYVERVNVADRPDTADALLAAFAEETGLAAPSVPWHTSRGAIAKLGTALAVTIGTLGKMAMDVQTLTRTEIAEASEPHTPGRGASSAMPQKRNPVSATLIRAAALQAPTLAATLLTTMLAEDERPAGAWHAEWQPLRELLLLAGGAAHTAAELAEGLTIDPARMAANLKITAGGVVAERIAAALIPVIGRAEAKQAVSQASAADGGLVEALRTLIGPVDVDLDALADPGGYLGVAGHLIDRAVGEYSEFCES